MRMPAAVVLAGLVLLALAACAKPAAQASGVAAAPPPSFVNKVWSVRRSSAVEPGQLYVFLSEGTLVVASPHGRPALGSWTYKDGVLTTVEEGQSHKGEVLKLSRDEFSLRVSGPGAPVGIVMVPADDVPLPR